MQILNSSRNSSSYINKQTARPENNTTTYSRDLDPIMSASYNLGRGSFRSKSRYWVDRNPQSRENVMRAALEELLQQPFIKVRPVFLLNPASGRKLELDAFSETLRLGAEFSGEQHDVFPNSCHSTRAEFDKQQQRDRLKLELCRQNGVKLIIVPHTVTRAAMKSHMELRLQELGFLPSMRS